MNKVKEREMIRELYAEQDWKCHVCGKPVTQRAHVLGDRKLERRIYGDEIIDSKVNWRGVCDLDCNNFVDIGRGLQAEIVYQIITSDESYEDKRAIINDLIIEKNKLREAKIEK